MKNITKTFYLPFESFSSDYIVLPHLLVARWTSYGYDFQNIHPLKTNDDYDDFVSWWLKNQDSTKLYKKEILNYFIINYHTNEINSKENNLLVTTLMLLIWRTRPDLQSAFVDIHGNDKKAFWTWWYDHGIEEYNLKSVVSNKEKHKNSFIEENLAEEMIDAETRVALIGHPTGVFGLGEDARLIYESLKLLGIKVDLYSASDHLHNSETSRNGVYTLNEYKNIYSLNIFCLPAFDMIGILFDHGSDIFEGTINLGIWQWELSEFPKEAILSIELVDYIYSISDFSSKSISKITDKVIGTLPLPVLEPSFIKKERKYFDLPQDHFLYIFSFDANSFINRKNPLGIIEAFQRAFPSKADVGCVIKVMNSKSNDIWNECVRRSICDSRIHIIDKVLNRSEFLALIDVCDVIVSLHRAEGFGRLMAEGFLLGKTSIASNYSGNLDYMNEENSYLVQGDIIPMFESDYLFSEGKEWFQPSINDASAKMIEVYEEQELAAIKSKTGKKLIQNNYSVFKTSNVLKEFINCLHDKKTNRS